MAQNLSPDELLEQFKTLPDLYKNRELELTMLMTPADSFWSADVNECLALHLRPGRTISGYLKLASCPSKGSQHVYACGEVAQALLNMRGQHRQLRVRARTVYGYVEPEPFGRRAEEFSGLLIDQILEIQDPEAGTSE